MPYIPQESRQAMADGELFPSSPGELNFLLTKICHIYLDQAAESYQRYNDVVGALECCKLELYRRKILPYEVLKIAEHGDL